VFGTEMLVGGVQESQITIDTDESIDR
jgi:hypothetical protein